MKQTNSFCAAASIVIMLAFGGHAKAVDDSAQSMRLDAVVVSATRAGVRSVEELPLSVTVITREQIQSSPGRTVDELLRQVVGVQLPAQNSTNGFPVNPSVAIRGVGLGDNGTRTLVLLDGVPMNGAYFGNVFWNRVPRQNIERIEIVRGASSSMFGAYAMGGVIHIITRDLPDNLRVELEAGAGSNDTVNANGYLAGAIADGLRVSLNANVLETDGFFLLSPVDRGAIDRPFSSEIFSTQLKLEYQAAPATRFYASANYFSDDQERNTFLSNTRTQTKDVAVGVDSTLDNGHRIQANVFYMDEQFDTDNTSLAVFGSRAAEFVSNRHATPSDDKGASFVWSRQLDGAIQSVSLGADLRQVEGDDDQDIFLANGTLAVEQLAAGKQRSYGLFGETSIKPLDNVELLASLRYDDFRNSDGEIVSNGVVTRFGNNSFDRFDPRLAATWRVSENLKLRGAWYRGFRAPTLAELYRRFGTTTFVGLPNPELDPERLRGGELGLDLTAGGFTSQLNVFQNNVEDFVGGVVVAFRPFTTRNANIGEIRSRGLEWINSYRFDERWAIDFGYTYTDAEIIAHIDDPELIGNRVEGAPKHFASASLVHGEADGFQLTLRGRYLGAQFQDSSNETRIGSHTVVDLAGSYPLSNQLSAYISIENLFDKGYTANALGGLPQRGAPLQVLAGLRWHY